MGSRKKKTKRREKEKKQRAEARKAKRWLSSLPEGSTVVELPGAEKMSEVLIDFVEPYYSQCETPDQIKRLLSVACIAWNAALMPGTERARLIQDSLETVPPEARQDLNTILAELILRKQMHFAENTRAILDYQFRMDPSGPRLNVLSTLGTP